MLKHHFASDVFSSILSFFLKGESVPFLAHVLLVMAPRAYFIEKTKFFCLRQEWTIAAFHSGAARLGCVDSALAPSTEHAQGVPAPTSRAEPFEEEPCQPPPSGERVPLLGGPSGKEATLL